MIGSLGERWDYETAWEVAAGRGTSGGHAVQSSSWAALKIHLLVLKKNQRTFWPTQKVLALLVTMFPSVPHNRAATAVGMQAGMKKLRNSEAEFNFMLLCFLSFFFRIQLLKGSASGPRDQLALSETFLAVPAEVLLASGLGVGVQPAP